MEKTKKHQNIAVPQITIERIKKVLSSRLGYRTMAEYVREAVRDKLRHDEYALEQAEEKERMKHNDI